MRSREPFALPRGTIRGLLALMLAGAAIAIVFVPVADKEYATGLFALAGFCIRDYFAVRKEQNEEDGPVLQEPAVND